MMKWSVVLLLVCASMGQDGSESTMSKCILRQLRLNRLRNNNSEFDQVTA